MMRLMNVPSTDADAKTMNPWISAVSTVPSHQRLEKATTADRAPTATSAMVSRSIMTKHRAYVANERRKKAGLTARATA